MCFACVWVRACDKAVLSRRPPVTPCTDKRTHASRRGLWEGGVALGGCARSAPLFSLLPAITALFCSTPPAAVPPLSFSAFRYFFPLFSPSLQSCDTSCRLTRFTVMPCDLCPPLILVAAAACLRPFPPFLQMCRSSSSSVGCHAALRSPPFWFSEHKSWNFFLFSFYFH